jgi:dienelactone hydrolase
MLSDIFGINTGRHKIVADTYSKLGFNVYLPEIMTIPYVGEMDIPKIMEFAKKQDLDKIKSMFNLLVKHLSDNGVKRFYCVGFCWGLWAAFKLAS